MPPTTLDIPTTSNPADPDWMRCTCCGTPLRDTATENCSHGRVPYPHDRGFGLCRRCGGDPTSLTDAGRMGWAARTFVESRIARLAKGFTPATRARLLALPVSHQTEVVFRLLEHGPLR
jgi:hypothetical protein